MENESFIVWYVALILLYSYGYKNRVVLIFAWVFSLLSLMLIIGNWGLLASYPDYVRAITKSGGGIVDPINRKAFIFTYIMHPIVLSAAAAIPMILSVFKKEDNK